MWRYLHTGSVTKYRRLQALTTGIEIFAKVRQSWLGVRFKNLPFNP